MKNDSADSVVFSFWIFVLICDAAMVTGAIIRESNLHLSFFLLFFFIFKKVDFFHVGIYSNFQN